MMGSMNKKHFLNSILTKLILILTLFIVLKGYYQFGITLDAKFREAEVTIIDKNVEMVLFTDL